MKRRWDDDVVFKNQARGTEEKGKKKEFVNVSPPPPPNRNSLACLFCPRVADQTSVGSVAVRFS